MCSKATEGTMMNDDDGANENSKGGESPQTPLSSFSDKAKTCDAGWTSNLKKRCKGEMVLARLYLWKILLALFALCYFCIVVFRNLAFYRHRTMDYYSVNGTTHERLKDLGFEITPDWSDSSFAKIMNEVIQNILNLSLIVCGLIPTFRTDLKRRPYFLHIGLRYFFAITTCHLLRPLFYLSTSLPGPAEHCQGQDEADNQPDSAVSIFLEAVPGANCGDLIFSGHMLMVTTCWMVQYRYYGEMFGNDSRIRQAVLYVGGLLIGVQAYIVICTRNHYSVDIVGGITIALFNWLWHETKIRPDDPNPESRKVQLMAIENTKCIFGECGASDVDGDTGDAPKKSGGVELC
eukprot:g4435.t1